MPKIALNKEKVDHCLPISEMGALLYQLIPQELKERGPVFEDILIETKIAERVLNDLASVNKVGDQVPFNCPGCGGILWKVDKDSALRYRSHVGHAYTAASLLAEQTEKMKKLCGLLYGGSKNVKIF